MATVDAALAAAAGEAAVVEVAVAFLAGMVVKVAAEATGVLHSLTGRASDRSHTQQKAGGNRPRGNLRDGP